MTAIQAESRRDYTGARERLQQLSIDWPDESRWLMELGAFEYRRALWADTGERRGPSEATHVATLPRETVVACGQDQPLVRA